ncbi:hypothetical protein J6590_034905 [Homalodisca vitripennis]|nr:hypothetical protein J6590_034905 [Homalodisca vitripennis]
MLLQPSARYALYSGSSVSIHWRRAFKVGIVTFTAGVDYLTRSYTAVSALQLLIQHRHHPQSVSALQLLIQHRYYPQCEYTLAPDSLQL